MLYGKITTVHAGTQRSVGRSRKGDFIGTRLDSSSFLRPIWTRKIPLNCLRTVSGPWNCVTLQICKYSSGIRMTLVILTPKGVGWSYPRSFMQDGLDSASRAVNPMLVLRTVLDNKLYLIAENSKITITTTLILSIEFRPLSVPLKYTLDHNLKVFSLLIHFNEFWLPSIRQ